MRWIILSAVVALAGCQTGAEQPPQPKADKAARLACETDGGSYRQGGILQDWICFKPTIDAGKSCNADSDCTGMCMADSKTCSTITPLFGCHSIIEDGETVEICID